MCTWHSPCLSARSVGSYIACGMVCLLRAAKQGNKKNTFTGLKGLCTACLFRPRGLIGLIIAATLFLLMPAAGTSCYRKTKLQAELARLREGGQQVSRNREKLSLEHSPLLSFLTTPLSPARLARLRSTMQALILPYAGPPLPFLENCASAHPSLVVHYLHHSAVPQRKRL